MKTFTATPEEFASGQAALKAHDLLKNRKPRGPRLPRKPVPRGAQQDRQIGTITPEDFGAGRPFWGHRAYQHRTGPVPTLKPLPETIVDELLEADADADFVSPADMADYVAGSPDYLIQKQPPEIAAVLEYAPFEFQQAFLNKREARWERDSYDAEWWPVYDDDDDGYWYKIAYYSDYGTSEGKIEQEIYQFDGDGNRDYEGSAEVGTPAWREMLEQYAYHKWVEANIDYSVWVAKTGDDPLHFFNVRSTEPREHAWLVGFVPEAERAKFWMAREVGGGEVGRPAVENPAVLPPEVRDYINIDANGINQDASWPEIVAMAQGGGADAPTIKQTRQGMTYAEFKVDLRSSVPVNDYAKQLKAEARKSVKRERSAARSALRAHRKMPHYVV